MGAGVRQSLNWDGLEWLESHYSIKRRTRTNCGILKYKMHFEIDNLISKKEQYITEIENYKITHL